MDRRTIWAILLMMVIAFLPTMFRKKPVPPSAGVVTDSVTAPAPEATPTPAAETAAPVVAAPAPSPADSGEAALPAADTVSVSTPLATYGVSTRGGQVVSLRLHDYASQEKQNKGTPVDLVLPGEPLLDMAIVRGSDTVHLGGWAFEVSGPQQAAGDGPASLVLTGRRGDLSAELTYTFARDDYQLGVRGRVTGLEGSGAQLLVGLGTGLPNTEADSAENFRHASLVTHQDQTERHDIAKVDAGTSQVLGGPFDWVALKSKYFVAGLLSFDSTGGRIASATMAAAADAGKRPTHARTRVSIPLPPSGEFGWTVYAGPMEYDRLGRLGRDFDDVNPYGWPGFRTLIRWFAVPVRFLMVWMHKSLHLSYGIVLIAFGLLVRLLLWPLNQKAMRASTAMQAIQPQLQAIQERYKQDPQRLQQEMFKLYKENNVNPFGGCWPMLLPMPILFALFFVIGNTIELRGVPFLWFPDLSLPDPLYVIPVLSGISMFALSKMGQMGIKHTPQTAAQAKLMLYMMPAMITFFGFQFASGLNLYWTVSNLASIPQQYLIGRERQKGMARQIVEVRTKADETISRTKPKKS